MISILTPCYRVIPCWNLRLTNICSQNFDDWEWVILDNSQDGCVSEYVERYFSEMEGREFLHCKKKVRCIHDPLDGVTVANGRFGVMRNRCLELANCGDNGIVLILDSDDFLHNGVLKKVHDVYEAFSKTEFVTGLCSQNLIQYLHNGNFFYHNGIEMWVDNIDMRNVGLLDDIGFAGKNWEMYKELYSKQKQFTKVLLRRNSKIEIPFFDIVFEPSLFMVETDFKWRFTETSGHLITFKKGAFLNKIGGYVTVTPGEDCVNYLMPHRLSNPVYITSPCYAMCMMLDENNYQDSATKMVVLENNQKENKADAAVWTGYLLDRYNFIGDCMKQITPITVE